ncbi:MAG: hypothetical protein MUQ10_17615 [Anaerolineae bacterium]|nr:hypothetical protein [Anaerolineae bacterium]
MIPFSLNERDGEVAVFYGAKDDPVKAGFDSLPGISFPIGLCCGYPVMHAKIADYSGSGYRTYCGWIQIITRICRKSADEGLAGRYTTASVDLPPSMEALSVPFVSYGTAPQLFDAPCRNLGGNYELKWVADTFLTTFPLRTRDEGIRRLLSFRWGYREYDESAGKPVALLPLDVTGTGVWNGHLPLLEERYPGWTFSRAQ